MTLEAMVITAAIAFLINIMTDMLNGITVKIKHVLKEKPIETLTLLGVLTLIYLQIK